MNNEIVYRKAMPEDLNSIMNMIGDAISVMVENHIYQWDSAYPSEKIILADIQKRQMFLGEIHQQIACVFVLNQEYDKEYEDGSWQYREASFFVIHRLCVNPVFQGKGIGRMTMLSIEKLLQREGIETIRLDAFSLNPFALGLYERLGYKRVGEVNWRKGLFYLYEKKIV